MIRRIFQLFRNPTRSNPGAWTPLDPEVHDTGARVRYREDGVEGVLSHVYLLDGVEIARVVFTGPRSSWVGLVQVDQLEAA